MRVEDLFEVSAFDAIERSVQEAERTTAGEIVPMIVERSDGYTGVRATAAAALAFGVGVLVVSLATDAWVWLPPAQLLGFLAGYWLVGRRWLLRFLIPPRVCAAAVDRAARRAFYEHNLIETRDRTGILIYVSLLEHRVEVLADRGIDERVEDGTWDGVVRHILDGIRAHKAEKGLIEAIAHCGEILASQFPPRPDDTDELANRVRRS